MTPELPDPYRFNDGSRVKTAADWPRRARELREMILEIEYGPLPPAPTETRYEVLHIVPAERFGKVRFITCRVHAAPHTFMLHLHVPEGAGPSPVVLNGDACWRHVSDEVVMAVLGRGNILAQFNRVEIVPDMPDTPGHGSVAAWAWGYHRCVDVLSRMDFVDASRIAIAGHSRGGKTTLLAGATDERIALTCANDSGCGGAGSHKVRGQGAEAIADILRGYPQWFAPQFANYINREAELPFDQHCLLSLIAPRPVLMTEALGDLWANPSGTFQTYLGAAEVYRFLGAPGRIGIWYREGGHVHNLADWTALLDFMDWQFHGVTPPCRFDTNPFPDLPKAFAWSAPL